MTDNFNKIYENLYYDYIYDTNIRNGFVFDERTEINFIRIIRRAIDKEDKDNILRSDAKYFLLVNFHHLVTKPLIMDVFWNSQKSVIKIEDLEVAIERDIKLIIETGNKESDGTSNEKLSGHSIISTVNNLWQELSTMKLDIWG